MLFFLILFLLFSYISYVDADVFSKPLGGSNQAKLEEALTRDTRNFYHRSGMDYNIFDGEKIDYELEKDSISLGCERFDLKKSLRNYMVDQIKSSNTVSLANQLINTPFLLLQYSSPTMADLLKHFDTAARLQISMRQQQCQDLEQIDDPIVHLRKQAKMDCLRQAGYEHNLDAAFESCAGDIDSPLNTLNSPRDGRNEIKKGVNLTMETLNRINLESKESLQEIELIIPHIFITSDSVRFRAPNQGIRQVMANYRETFLNGLKKIIDQYRIEKNISKKDLDKFSVIGFPMTENQVKNISILGEPTGYLAINKIASQLAYLRTMDLYSKALEYLKRVLNHPAIEMGYKRFMQADYDFIADQMGMLKEEKDRLEGYFRFMGTILDEEDIQKLKILAKIKEESKQEEKKGLFNL